MGLDSTLELPQANGFMIHPVDGDEDGEVVSLLLTIYCFCTSSPK